MKAIIDRFEGNIAVLELENETMLDMERSRLPQNANEGDCLIIDGNSITIDNEETKRRKACIEELMNELFEI